MRPCSGRPQSAERRGRAARDRPAASVLAHRAAGGRRAGRARAEVVKSLVFVLDDGGRCWRSSRAMRRGRRRARARGRRAREVRLARGQEVRELTGYRPGAVPPCAWRRSCRWSPTRVFAPDGGVLRRRTTTTMLKIRSADLEALLEPRELPIAQRVASQRPCGPTTAPRPSKWTPADEVESATMTETLTHTDRLGRAAGHPLASQDLERLDAAALDVLADTGVASRPSGRAPRWSRRARRPTARASRIRPSSCAGWSPWRRRA